MQVLRAGCCSSIPDPARPFWFCEFIVALAWRDAAPDFLSLDPSAIVALQKGPHVVSFMPAFKKTQGLTPNSLIAKAEAQRAAIQALCPYAVALEVTSEATNQSANESAVTPEALLSVLREAVQLVQCRNLHEPFIWRVAVQLAAPVTLAGAQEEQKITEKAVQNDAS